MNTYERQEQANARYEKRKLEAFAQLLHESGREAVAGGYVYRNDLPLKPFCEWDSA